MQIQLKPARRSSNVRIAAAFLPGPDPAEWLLEISRWALPLERLRCYALPRALQTVEPGGLLVVFQHPADALQAELKSPYQMLGGKLYIPADAEIFPAVNEAEWADLLRWDVQVMHPHIGLVGFHYSDALDLSTLAEFGPPRPADWGLAQAGIAPRPPFRQIEVMKPKPDDLIESLRKDEGSKPLSDLSSENQTDRPAATDGLRRYLLERALAVTNSYRNAFGDPARSYDGKDWLARIERWVQRQLDAIVNKRRSEIDRLLDLFDRDTDEALRYALPLEDPYAKRGNAPPGAVLGPRNTDFSLQNIGGGSASDAWTLGHKHLSELRQKYHEAARKAITAGEYRRAAYIYAHLLHDYATAANVLTQGGYWREAAVLHKEHLHNLPAAAECLEKGKLYWEATEIYEKLGRHEKAGALYRLLGEQEKSEAAWEQHIEKALLNDDYMDAARVLLEKKRDTDRAKDLLLQAWSTERKQAESCLQRYFQTVVETEPGQLASRLQEVAQLHTPQMQRPQLLQALTHLVARHGTPDVLESARHIAYSIISEQAQQGDTDKLLLLSRFLPDDRLVASDSSRFVDRKTPPKAPSGRGFQVQLDKTVAWLDALAHRNQMLAFGAKNGQLHLARINWHGHVEHYIWDSPQPVRWPLTLYHFPQRSNYVFVHDANGNGFEEKKLLANTHFDTALQVGWPTHWHTNAPMSLGADDAPDTYMLVDESNSVICLYQFNLKHQRFLESKPLLGDYDEQGMSDLGGLRLPMIRLGGFTFIANREFLLKIKENLEAEVIPVGERVILKMLPMQGPNSLRLVVVTTEGSVVLDPFQEKKELRDVDFFAVDEEYRDAQLIGQDHLVIARPAAVEVYEISRMSCSGRLVRRISNHGWSLAAVLPAAHRERFLVLDRGGKMKEFGLED